MCNSNELFRKKVDLGTIPLNLNLIAYTTSYLLKARIEILINELINELIEEYYVSFKENYFAFRAGP